MARAVAVGRPGRRPALVAIAIAVCAGLVVGACGVWFAGFDAYWAVTAALALGPVGAVIAILVFDEQVPWEPPARETPRGTRLTVSMLESSLAACDRLARPTVMRRVRALPTAERDDRLARLTVVRQMRALLIAELKGRGLDPDNCSEEGVVALLGSDALPLLAPHDDDAVTTTAIGRCLDAVERLATVTPGSR